jgi:hypothetical protein
MKWRENRMRKSVEKAWKGCGNGEEGAGVSRETIRPFDGAMGGSYILARRW